MLVSRKKNLLILLIFILTGAACVGYYFYNKGPVNIKKASAKKVEAAALYNSFAADSTTAQKNYSGKILIVSGTVAQTTHNQQGRSVILLKTAGSSSFINCTLEQEITSGIKENQVIQIKGICSGLGQADADLGLEPDLYLERCILQ